ncbi:MAG TPA: hypothetical protein VFQ70_01535 [Candidatus Saccharimonadaceae bacterium]|nr:hypothetical protein [Candidatus Saccharimonadaceae bacterium]
MREMISDRCGLYVFSDPEAKEKFGHLKDLLLDPTVPLGAASDDFVAFAGPTYRSPERAQMLRHTSGMLVKNYGASEKSLPNALLQLEFMNLLAGLLDKSEGTVHAVRHPLVARRQSGEVVALMEPAPGIDIPSTGMGLVAKKEILRTVRAEVTHALGSRVLSRLMVNDLYRQGNHMTNVFVDGTDRITLIDQPYEGSPLARGAFKLLQLTPWGNALS